MNRARRTEKKGEEKKENFRFGELPAVHPSILLLRQLFLPRRRSLFDRWLERSCDKL